MDFYRIKDDFYRRGNGVDPSATTPNFRAKLTVNFSFLDRDTLFRALFAILYV